jgi:hypothetical protein
MEIITDVLHKDRLKKMAAGRFGTMVKAVVDADRELLAVDAELHSDLEALLLENGSKQKNIWGINLYPDLQGSEYVEFDSIINMRPSQDNRSRSIDSAEIRKKVIEIVEKRIGR